LKHDGFRALAHITPNDCRLDGTGVGGARLSLVTGPNMAGKSTFIRQTALLVILAHAGSFVPAQRAVIGLTDRVFTRVGADDALHAGQSTFMVEMTETAAILHQAGPRSLWRYEQLLPVGAPASVFRRFPCDTDSYANASSESLSSRLRG
jgi:hypothetical protein